MKTFVKRLQTRASRKGIKVSLQRVRNVYQTVVTDLENPTEEEMNLVLSKLESSTQEIPESLTISESETVNINPDSNANVGEVAGLEESAIASVLPNKRAEESSPAIVQLPSSDDSPIKSSELKHTNSDEFEEAIDTASDFVLRDTDKHSLIYRQASALNVELNTSELTTIAGHIADNYASFEEAVERIQSIILMVLDQRFQRASDVLDNTLLTILNRASGNFQSLNSRASQGFTAIAQELKRVDTDFKSQSSALESSLKQYLLNS